MTYGLDIYYLASQPTAITNNIIDNLQGGVGGGGGSGGNGGTGGDGGFGVPTGVGGDGGDAGGGGGGGDSLGQSWYLITTVIA